MRPFPVTWRFAPLPRVTSEHLSSGKLRDARPGLDGEVEQRLVPSPCPGAEVASAEQGVDLVVVQVGDDLSVGELDRDGEDTLDRAGMLGVAERRVGEQRVDRREAVVAGAHAVVPHHLQVLQEGTDERRVKVGEVELIGPLARPLGGKAQQQAEGVPVRGDGVGARSSLGHQALGQERFERRQRERSSLNTSRSVAQAPCDELDQLGR